MVNMSAPVYPVPATSAPSDAGTSDVGGRSNYGISKGSRLPGFATSWSRLQHTNSRFADGCAVLNKLNPRHASNRNVHAIEVRARPPSDETGAALPIPDIATLVRIELEMLDPLRCMCSPRPNGSTPTIGNVLDGLASEEPLVVGVHAPHTDGLGALPFPLLAKPTHTSTSTTSTTITPTTNGKSSALLFGAGAIARTCTPGRGPVLTRQVVGQALILFWPESHANRAALANAEGFRHVIARLDALAGLRFVVLRAGDACILPAGTRYITMALGDENTPFAVQMKYSVPAENMVPSNSAVLGKRARQQHVDSEQEECDQCRLASGFKKVKVEEM